MDLSADGYTKPWSAQQLGVVLLLVNIVLPLAAVIMHVVGTRQGDAEHEHASALVQPSDAPPMANIRELEEEQTDNPLFRTAEGALTISHDHQTFDVDT